MEPALLIIDMLDTNCDLDISYHKLACFYTSVQKMIRCGT